MGTTNQKNGAADSPERVIALEFQKLGLSGPEVKAYLALLAEGNVSGYQLAKRAGLGAAKVYGLLSRLRERGFVLAADTRPVKYFARDPDEVLQILRNDFEASLGSLQQSLERMHNHQASNELPAWTMTDRADVLRRAAEVLGQAGKSVFLAAWPKELRPVRPALAQAVARGVDLRLVAYGRSGFKGGQVYQHRPTDYPYRERRERRFVLVADNREAIIANFAQDGGGGGLRTNNPGLVQLFRDFVIHEIYIILLEKDFPEIRQVVGDNWEKVRLT